MRPTIMKLWTKALRSGTFKQGRDALLRRKDGEDSYCCLGVLCELFRKSPAGKRLGAKWNTGLFASRYQQSIGGVSFTVGHVVKTGVLPPAVVSWAGMTDDNPTARNTSKSPKFSTEQRTLTGYNDAGASFEDIAAIIENGHKQGEF